MQDSERQQKSHKLGSPHAVQTVGVVLLLLVFAFSALFLIMLGAGVYERNVKELQEVSEGRTIAAYLTQRVRQADAEGQIRVGTFPVPMYSSFYSDALIFSREVRGEIYETYLYTYGGSLRELTVRKDAEITPDMGAEILDAVSIMISQDEEQKGLLHIELVQQDGNQFTSEELHLFVRSLGGDA